MENSKKKSKYLWILMQIRPNIHKILISNYIGNRHGLKFGL